MAGDGTKRWKTDLPLSGCGRRSHPLARRCRCFSGQARVTLLSVQVRDRLQRGGQRCRSISSCPTGSRTSAPRSCGASTHQLMSINLCEFVAVVAHEVKLHSHKADGPIRDHLTARAAKRDAFRHKNLFREEFRAVQDLPQWLAAESPA